MGTHGVIYTFDFMSEKTLLGLKIKKDATVKLHFWLDFECIFFLFITLFFILIIFVMVDFMVSSIEVSH